MSDALVIDLLERVKHRFYGKYRGTVTDVDAATMRVKANVPAVLPKAQTGWCEACVPYAGPNVGFVMLPEIGSGVWIEFEGGDVSAPIWTGCYWRRSEVPSAASATVKSIITSTGALAFDAAAGSVTLGDTGSDSLTISAGSATLSAGSGKIDIGAAGVSVNDGAFEVT
jgi:uncharacterized protein involved in type VI secretion and phage assembly